MSLAQVIEERGYFWWHEDEIPEGEYAPNSCVPGYLKISEDGHIDLELDNVLPSSRGGFPNFLDQKMKPIQGFLKGSGKYILINSYMNGGSFSTHKISYERYSGDYCLIKEGIFRNDGDLSFQSIGVRLEGFEDWLRLGSIEFERTESSSRISSLYNKPKDIFYSLDIGEITIKYYIIGPYSGKWRQYEISLKEFAIFSFHPKDAFGPIEAKNLFAFIQDFFVLLTDSDYCLNWPILKFNNESCDFFFPRMTNQSHPPERFESCTNLICLRENVGKLFANWLSKRNEFGSGFYLYFGTRRAKSFYPENRFMNLIWGIESYHRIKNPDKQATSPTLLEKFNRILKNVQLKKDKKWISNQFEKCKEPKLETRIFESFVFLTDDIEKGKLQEFAKKCAKFRNDISHFGGQRQQGDYTKFVLEVGNLIRALLYLYHALILHEIGIQGDMIKEWFHNHRSSFKIKSALVDVGLFDRSILETNAPEIDSFDSENLKKL